jgi:hypothetical protein
MPEYFYMAAVVLMVSLRSENCKSLKFLDVVWNSFAYGFILLGFCWG